LYLRGGKNVRAASSQRKLSKNKYLEDLAALLEGHHYGLCVEAWEDFLSEFGLTLEDAPHHIRLAWGVFLWLHFPERYESKPPSRPTGARPGTEEKVREMRRRARRKQDLFHEQDAPMDDFETARVPVINPRNHWLIGWRIVGESGATAEVQAVREAADRARAVHGRGRKGC
jgi:hypothetical protein